MNCTILYPSAIAGPGDPRNGFITQMIRIYLKLRPRLSVKGGYDFVDVRDVAEAALNSVDAPSHDYILANEYATVSDVFNMVAAHIGKKPVAAELPLWALYPLAAAGGAVFALRRREPPITSEAVRLMGTRPLYDHSRAGRELGFLPRPLSETFCDMADYIAKEKRR